MNELENELEHITLKLRDLVELYGLSDICIDTKSVSVYVIRDGRLYEKRGWMDEPGDTYQGFMSDPDAESYLIRGIF